MCPYSRHLPRSETMWGFGRCDMKCQSITRRTIRVLQQDPHGDWNVICVGLGLLLALPLIWLCQKTASERGSSFSSSRKWLCPKLLEEILTYFKKDLSSWETWQEFFFIFYFFFNIKQDTRTKVLGMILHLRKWSIWSTLWITGLLWSSTSR